jgi:hypothetical protein
MAWSVIALGGLIPAFLWFSFRGQTSFGTGLREFRVQFTMPHIPMMALFAIGYIVAPLVVGAVTL